MRSEEGLSQPEARTGSWATYLALGGLVGFALLVYIPGFLDFLNPVFASQRRFFSLWIGFLLLGLFMLVRTRRVPRARVAFAVATVLILAVPLLLPAVYGAYRPYAEPAPGYVMHWITKPKNSFESAFKSAQRKTEHHGCTYSLLGWSGDNSLYFRSDCGETTWRYAPEAPPFEHEPAPVDEVPPEVGQNVTVNRGAGNLYPALPAGFTPDALQRFIPYETAVSPDGRWIAVAIKNYYGPRDVVVLSTAILAQKQTTGRSPAWLIYWL